MTLLDRLGGREAIRQGVEDTFRLLSRHPHPSHVDERAPLDTLPDYVLLLAGTLEAL